MTQPCYSKSHLLAQLAALGICRGQTLMLHAGLRKIGPVEGGADVLIETLQTAVGPEGNLIMVLGADPDHIFDPVLTPVEPGMGALAEVFRLRKDTIVNHHPIARYAAWGKNAHDLIDNTPLNHYHGPRSVLARLVEAGGAVLRLGADIDTLTLTHYAEYLAKLPFTKREVLRQCRLADGTELTLKCLDDDDGIADPEKYPTYFSDILQDFLKKNRTHCRRVGDCAAEIINARAFTTFAVQWLEQHLIC